MTNPYGITGTPIEMSLKPLCKPSNAHWWDVEASRADHDKALALCANCPLATKCINDAILYKESGTWGGQFFSNGQMVRFRDDVETGICGTLSGHARHRKLRERVCEDCKEAYNAYKREWRERNGSKPQEPARCGTEAGETAHRRRGERPCEACRTAARVANAERRRRRLSTGSVDRALPHGGAHPDSGRCA